MIKRSRAVFPGGLAWTSHRSADDLVLRRLSGDTEVPGELALLTQPTGQELSLDALIAANPRAHRNACPDLSAQLVAARSGTITDVICNLVDHEPVLRLNDLLAGLFPRTLVGMADDLRKMTRAARAIVAMNASASAFDRVKDAARGRDVQVVGVETRYPQAHTTLLLYSLLNVRLPPRLLPTDARALVLDGPALWMLSRCAREGSWPAEAPLAVRDHVRGECRYWLAPTGTPVAKLLEAASLVESWRAVHIGDLLRDVEAPSQMELGDGELVLHLLNPRGELERGDSPCVRCGWCVDHCPVIANPAMLLEAAQNSDPSLALDGGIDACIECGVCDHVCPSELPLAAAIRSLKSGTATSAETQRAT